MAKGAFPEHFDGLKAEEIIRIIRVLRHSSLLRRLFIPASLAESFLLALGV